MLVLTWNLFHGRAKPAAGRPLAAEFTAALAGWAWDVALLQEVPPWWAVPLAERSGAAVARALTARNECLAVRRAIARRNPDLLTANGGGANAILVRGAAITAVEEVELTRAPERRVGHGVRLADGTWLVNLHASTHPDAQRKADLALASRTALAWAAGASLVFGGDLNATRPALAGLEHAAGHWVDHVFVAGGLAPSGAGETLDAGALSDHAPLRVAVRPRAPRDAGGGQRPH